MSKYAQNLTNKKKTPQTEKASKKQKRNNAGGFSFVVDDWTRLERFLILGAEAGTYYVGKKKLTKQNAKCILTCLAASPKRTIDAIVDVSVKGRAPKNDAAIFALALIVANAATDGSHEAKALALEAFPAICRTGRHLFQWVSEYEALGGGWGRSVSRAVANWYLKKDTEKLAYQLVKYRNRHSWTHADVFRRCHPRPTVPAMQALARWVISPEDLGKDRTIKRKSQELPVTYKQLGELPAIVGAFEEASALKERSDVPRLVKLITEHRLPHEALPVESLMYPEIWEALLEDMPLEAMVRNLGKMTSVGILYPFSPAQNKIFAQLADMASIRFARLHPMKILIALKTYAQGHGDKGSLYWTPNQRVIEALDEAFYASFGIIDVPTGKRHYLAIDVSGSMTAPIHEDSSLTCREAAAAMAMVTARTEENSVMFGFCDRMVDLKVSRHDKLETVVHKLFRSDFGRTDCSMPMRHALSEGIPVDGFFVYTDSETYGGSYHTHQAIEQYRKRTGIAAKMAVVAMTSTGFTIADPDDAGMIDVVGFDTSVPQVLTDFMR